MAKYVMLRDDDTNFYTTPEELKSGYADIWGKVPVTLATIPFVHGSERKILDYDRNVNKFELLDQWEKNASCEELYEYHTTRPIGKNTEIVDFLKPLINKKYIEIAQHGVEHRYDGQGPEMFGDKTSLAEIKSGRDYLQKVFECDVNIFIPPSNSIDEKCCQYIKSLGMGMVNSGVIRYRSGMAEKLSTLTDCRYFAEKCIRKITGFKPGVYHRRGIDIVYSHTFGINSDAEQMLKTAEEELDKYGFFALGTHYRLLADTSYQQRYLQVIRGIMSIGDVKFVIASEYYRRICEKYE